MIFFLFAALIIFENKRCDKCGTAETIKFGTDFFGIRILTSLEELRLLRELDGDLDADFGGGGVGNLSDSEPIDFVFDGERDGCFDGERDREV